ncbi:MAG: hypothetical protein K0R25_1242 [Rickettsiaceae bacterium]|jgi:glycosyltransferase involved in cell wall biosynthesis|nr:hypothetical protein [Rickettsiaceae bacterium]
MKIPLVSIIMPVKNGSNYLGEALSVIKSQNVDMEIIVVDDGSNDDSAQIAKSFGCVVLTHQNCKGLVASKNTALKVAKGKYIMFHDHDDVMNQGALSQMLKAFEENEEIFVVMTQLKDFFSPELPEEERKKIAIRLEPYFGLFSGAILMKKDVFDIIGLFDENIQAGDIIEWKNKIDQHKLLIKRLTFVASNRRIHNSNFGRTNKGTEYKDYAAILRSKIKNNIANQTLN